MYYFCIDSPKSSLKMFSVDESTSLQKNQNYSMNNSNACVNNYTSYENRFSDKKMLYDLYENLSIDEEQNNISCANNIKETSKMYCPEYDSSEFVGNRTSKNNETAQKNIDSLKKVMINQPKKIETKIFHENKSMNCLNNVSIINKYTIYIYIMYNNKKYIQLIIKQIVLLKLGSYNLQKLKSF